MRSMKMGMMRMSGFGRLWACLLCVGTIWAGTAGAEVQTGKPSQEAVQAIKGFQISDNLEVNPYASEPLLGNPVSFCLDKKGRIYVAETYRFGKGTTDNRGHEYWLMDDLASETIQDRLEKFKKWAERDKHPMSYYTNHSDRVRRLLDTDDDGQADRSNIFAGGFNEPLTGLAAGVLAYEGNIYFTCIPHLWLLKDPNQDGKAEVRKKLHSGFGVRSSLLGHDMHGLVLGPDGRIYFSIGDRGYNVKTDDGRRLVDPMDVGRGAVFRCEPDGSNLEVVHRGLRNPQELAFDNYGNLFSVDNNSDAGDKARLVYIVNGGDSGWFMPFQTMGEGFYNKRGPWHAEKLWHTEHPGQPAWIVPPIDHITSGPSGFAHYPGVGLPNRYNGRFLVCDFRGNPANSGIRSFGVEPDGAGFNMVDPDKVIWKILATDVEFGYDGRIYVSDWINGWSGTGKGRIYTLHHPKTVDSKAVQKTERLFRNGFDHRSTDELVKLLRSPDQRVRIRAELTLAGRGSQAVQRLKAVATSSDEEVIPRLHGIWGAGVAARRGSPGILQSLVPLLNDEEAEVRAQTAKVIGQADYGYAGPELTDLLSDDSNRVRYFAAQALGNLGYSPALKAVVAMIRENNDEDVYLRHGGVMALTGIVDADALLNYRSDGSAAVRRAITLALRREHHPRVAQFLHDPEVSIATEAARAIYDLPIKEAMPDLANLIEAYTGPEGVHPKGSERHKDAFVRRIVNANFRLGEPKHAKALVAFTANPNNTKALRLEALKALGDWSDPSPRDRIYGMYRPLADRSVKPVKKAMRSYLPRILATASEKVRAEATKLASELKLETGDDVFFATVGNSGRSEEARIQALRYLAKQDHPKLKQAIDEALSSDSARLRVEARRVLAEADPGKALAELKETLADGTLRERQAAFETLAGIKQKQVDELFVDWLDRLLQGKVARAIQLDVLQAAKQRQSEEVKAKLAQYKESLSKDDPLDEYLVALKGGRPNKGKEIFFNHSAAQCVRCHQVGETGGQAGPDLSDVGKRRDARYILESLIQPNAAIAQGYEMVTLQLKNNKMVVGTLQSETKEEMVVASPSGQVTTVNPKRVKSRSTTSASSMPPMGGILSKGEIRDVVAYLKSLK